MTKLVYLNESFKFAHEATVTAVQDAAVQCNETIFYPQGGGQPTDVGIMTCGCTEFTVKSVRKSDGLVNHEGSFSGPPFKLGDRVTQLVDESTRRHHMRLHSGGHAIDHAIQIMGLPLIPGKGYHFPQGPNVEYRVDGELPEDMEQLRKDIEEHANDVVNRGLPIHIRYAEVGELSPLVARMVPSTLTEKVRLIEFEGTPWALPCGGTHVANSRDIGPIQVRKVTSKGGVLKVSYSV